MSDAMSFEYLIRRIYQVGRYGNSGANADIYREMERAERMYLLEIDNIEKKEPRLSMQDLDDLAYEHRVECRKVWSIVESAIRKGITKYRGKFTSDEILEMENSIIEPRIVTKGHIDKAIDIAEKIYVNHKIFPV